MSQEQGNTINLDSMSLQELQQMLQQEEQRLNALTARYSQLRQLTARLDASKLAVQDISTATAKSETKSLIPLTDSVYVPARVGHQEDLLIELGTGYFCEKSPKETIEYLERKQKIVDGNSDNITKVIQVTRQNMQAVQSAMQGKLLEIRAKQEGNRYRASVEGNQ